MKGTFLTNGHIKQTVIQLDLDVDSILECYQHPTRCSNIDRSIATLLGFMSRYIVIMVTSIGLHCHDCYNDIVIYKNTCSVRVTVLLIVGVLNAYTY